jgi:hypothetical protein
VCVKGQVVCVPCHEETAAPDGSGSQAINPIGVETALTTSRDGLKMALAIQGEYEILEANLCYVRQKDDVFAPAWHFKVCKGTGSLCIG